MRHSKAMSGFVGMNGLGRVLLAVAVLSGVLVADIKISAAQDPPRGQVPECAPGELISHRTRDSKTVLLADCSYTTTFGANLHYEADPGRWEEVDLRFRGAAAAHIADRNSTIVRIVGARLDVTDRETGRGIRWLLPSPPTVRTRKAHFESDGLQWEYAVTDLGVKLAATVVASRGPRTYDFSYQLLGGRRGLEVDDSGQLQGGDFHIPRAFALGADGQTYEAGKWRLLHGNRAAFDFDDSQLPAEAFPYILDPTTSFNPSKPEDEGHVTKSGSSYPPASCAGWSDTSSTVTTMKGVNAKPEYYTMNGFMSWDTSSLPDSASVNSATLKFYASSKDNPESRSLTADWYSAWPIDCNDFSDSAQTTAIGGLPLANIPTGSSDTIVGLSGSAAGVSRTGRTGLRTHISGGQPAGWSSLSIWQLGNASNIGTPQLNVTYTLSNGSPSISSVTDSPDPVAAGATTTFTVGWSDPDGGDSVRGLICKTNAVTSTGLCAEGAWAAGNYSTTSPSTVPFITSSNAAGTNTYYAFACDISGACSSALSGTFTVTVPNTAPSISSAADAPDPVTAGNAVQFNLGWTDPNSGDTVRALICKSNAVTSGSCSSGAWSTGTASSTSPSTATYFTSSSNAGTNSYYAFVCDQSNACSSSLSGTFTVLVGAPPTISSSTVTPNPAVEGQQVTFTVGWTDPGDSVRAVICETNAIAGGVCPGGGLASGNLSQTSPSSATYTTTAFDVGTNSYYAFACDSSNACSSAASGTFTVNAAGPSEPPVITLTPEDPTRAPTLTFEFQGSGASYECSLTGPSGTVSPYAPCVSPKGYSSSGLSGGLYVFEVRAVSAAGQRSEAAAEEIAVNTGGDGEEVEGSPHEEDADVADAQAQQFAGNRYGGTWKTYDADQTINLHVAVAGMTPIDELLIEALSTEGVVVIAEPVTYPISDLDQFAETVTPVDQSRRYRAFTDIENNRVILEVEDASETEPGEPAADLGSSIPADAVEGRWVRSVVLLTFRANTRSTYPPYKAGKRWGRKDQNADCGVAFAMTYNPTGSKVGLTAGHCGGNTTHVYMGTNRRKYVGDMFHDGQHGQEEVASDTALITLNQDHATRNVFIKRDFSRMVEATDRDIDEGDKVCMSGSKNGIDCGKVTKRVPHALSEDGWFWKQLWCTNIDDAGEGDSGSAVYRPTWKAYRESADEWVGGAVAIGVVVAGNDDIMCFEAIGQAETQRNATVWD